MAHNSHKNRALWIKFGTVNHKSILYSLSQKLLMQRSTSCSSCHDNQVWLRRGHTSFRLSLMRASMSEVTSGIRPNEGTPFWTFDVNWTSAKSWYCVLQKHKNCEVCCLNFVEVVDIQLLRIQLLAMCLGCHGNCCSWYSAALIIFVKDCKVLNYD